MPSRIRGFSDEEGGNGTDGDSLSIHVMVQGGCFELVRPCVGCEFELALRKQGSIHAML